MCVPSLTELFLGVILNVSDSSTMSLALRSASLFIHNLLHPLHLPFQIERENVASSQTLRAALSRVETTHPGFTYELVMGLVRKADLSVNMNESILRLQGSVNDTDCEYQVLSLVCGSDVCLEGRL